MSTSIRGVVKDGVIVPSTPLPEGVEVEIQLCGTQELVSVDMGASSQSEFEAWQLANESTLNSIGQAVEQTETPGNAAPAGEVAPPTSEPDSSTPSSKPSGRKKAPKQDT